MAGIKEQIFRQTFKVVKDMIKWYPGHMEKGMLSMQKLLRSVDCVIEVHDARVAISGRNPHFVKKLLGVRPHILVLNKVDLINQQDVPLITSKLKEEGIDNILFTNCLKANECKGLKKLIPRALQLISNFPRYNRVESNDLCMMIIGIPNVGKSSLINALRIKNLRKGKAAPVGPIAGITRAVQTKIKVNSNPPLYLIDTPGILPPNITDSEAALKLAACACFKDTIVSNYVLADFILYWLNKNGIFFYVQEYNLDSPKDDIVHVLAKIVENNNLFIKRKDVSNNSIVKVPDLELAASEMVNRFRQGRFGVVNFDKDLLFK